MRHILKKNIAAQHAKLDTQIEIVCECVAYGKKKTAAEELGNVSKINVSIEIEVFILTVDIRFRQPSISLTTAGD